MPIAFEVNGRRAILDTDPTLPLLWALREHLGLKGCKYGCGIGSCGACSVEVDGQLARSCVLPLQAVAGKRVLTIEGLAREGKLDPVQQAWLDEDVAQCGYCQAGQIMAARALLKRHPRPSEAQIAATMLNLCRCGTYTRVRAAIQRAAAALGGGAA
ncbi:(2Fe-2S)-binding protein [Massilia sp. TS11]|uniref:(2Fe-2S)-binding protein n=1 Tax=Massilia sp. TS11 TaxID=2908003 RepID=UPI001EDA7455|nr:(2Fe-2S)-binding protein [Massilia sp. TS11]MCG2585508.1 (2Fe-2S)-binding protein [Massilia sp. TS11]